MTFMTELRENMNVFAFCLIILDALTDTVLLLEFKQKVPMRESITAVSEQIVETNNEKEPGPIVEKFTVRKEFTVRY